MTSFQDPKTIKREGGVVKCFGFSVGFTQSTTIVDQVSSIFRLSSLVVDQSILDSTVIRSSSRWSFFRNIS